MWTLEYDLKGRSLKLLRSGSRLPLVHARVARAEQFEIPSFDGLTIQAFLFTTNAPEARGKAGTIIYIPPRTYQIRWNYDIQPQLIANCGFNYVGINYRGIDGFGTSFSRLYDPKLAAQDVITLTRRLIKDGTIDRRCLFLMSQSEGSAVMKEVLVQAPTLWTAGIFQGGVAWSSFEEFKPQLLPPLFITIGRNDPSYNFMREVERWAKKNDLPTKTHYLDNYGHFNADSMKRMEQEKEIAQFLIETGFRKMPERKP